MVWSFDHLETPLGASTLKLETTDDIIIIKQNQHRLCHKINTIIYKKHLFFSFIVQLVIMWLSELPRDPHRGPERHVWNHWSLNFAFAVKDTEACDVAT